jgi:hypothetical protein
MIVLVVAAACTNLPTAVINYGSGARFVPTVADALDDVGLGASVAVDTDGLPFVTYFGFIPSLAPGQLPPQRPIGAPFLPAVLLAAVNSDGVFTRGAIAEAKPNPAPNGITSLFRPVDVDGYNITPRNTNGTSVAVDSDGTIEAAWTQNDGVWYGTASATSATDATIEQVEKSSTIAVAGPIGRPSIALDSEGNPWISYAVETDKGTDVRVAMKAANAKAWTSTTVFSVPACDCPPPGPAPITMVGDIPVVGFLDDESSVVRVATFNGSKWVPTSIPGASDAEGLSMTVAGDQSVAAFYSRGSINVSTGGTTTEVALADLSTPSPSVTPTATTSPAATTPPPTTAATPSASGSAAPSASGSATPSAAPSITGPAAQPIKPGRGNLAPTTGLAVDAKGNLFLTWQDKAGVHLATGADAAGLSDVSTTGTDGGVTPAVAVGSNGNVYVTWYDPVNQNLMLGTQGDLTDVLLANPSPSPTISLAPTGNEVCGKNGKVQLDITAQDTSFLTNCLVGPASQPFDLTFDNEAQGITHNVGIYDEQGGTELFAGAVFPGIATQTYHVDVSLDPGTYFFQCDVHPTEMTGTFVAIKAKGG